MRTKIGLFSLLFMTCISGTALASPMKYDIDKDGTLDLAEMEAAAGAAFDRLDKDSDKTLAYDEAKGQVSKKAFIAADPDKDATLTKDEYIAMAEKLFKAADVNNEGTLDRTELKSRAGRALLKLLR
jgi:hypothetical protein